MILLCRTVKWGEGKTHSDDATSRPPNLSPCHPQIVYDGEMSEHVSPLDLDAIERDLADVDAALTRLDNDTYWVDEVTGQPLSADLLAAQPTARRNNP